MRNYEIMFISKKSLGEEGFSLVTGLVTEAIEKLGGSVTKNMEWGRRKFAYPINKDTEGYYRVLNFDLEEKNLVSLNTKLKLIEGIVRYMISKPEGGSAN